MKLLRRCVFVVAVLLPLSSASGTPSGIAFKNTVILPDPDSNIPSVPYGERFGGDIAVLSDLDRDGNDDVAVAEAADGEGHIYIIFLEADGSATGAVKHVLGENGLPAPGLRARCRHRLLQSPPMPTS